MYFPCYLKDKIQRESNERDYGLHYRVILNTYDSQTLWSNGSFAPVKIILLETPSLGIHTSENRIGR